MRDLYFEGDVKIDSTESAHIRTATPVQIGDRELETFVIRLSSVSTIGRHPVMDQLAGKKVRITFTILGNAP